MSLIDYVKDVYGWWSWEITGIVGLRSDPPAAAAVVRISRDGIRIERPAAEPVTVEADAVGSTIRALAGGSRIEADVLIEPDRSLRRPLSRLRLPRSRAVAMSRLDYAAATPLKPDEAFLFTPGYREDAAETAYYIVRRRHLEPALDSLRQAGIAVGRLGLVDARGIVLPDRDSVAAAVRPSVREAVTRRVLRWSAATAVVGLLAVFAAAHWRYATAIQAVDQELAVAETNAAAVQRVVEERERRISRIAAARSAKSEAVPVVRILEEMARTIPDDTWLTEFDLRETTITFSGISRSASDLIPALEASPLFRSPTFSQQVVRAADAGGERFTITMEIEGPANG